VKGQEKYFQPIAIVWLALARAVLTLHHSFGRSFSFPRSGSKIPTTTVKESSVPAPSETELSNFLNCIKRFHSKPALLSLSPAHSDSYVPNALHPELPDVLSNLFDISLVEVFFLLLLLLLLLPQCYLLVQNYC